MERMEISIRIIDILCNPQDWPRVNKGYVKFCSERRVVVESSMNIKITLHIMDVKPDFQIFVLWNCEYALIRSLFCVPRLILITSRHGVSSHTSDMLLMSVWTA